MRGLGNERVYLLEYENDWTHYGCAICGWFEERPLNGYIPPTIDEHLIGVHHLMWPGAPYYPDREEQNTPTGKFEWVQVTRVLR